MTYFVTVKLRAQRLTVASSITSASSGRRITPKLPIRLRLMPQGEPTIDQIDALVAPATPHFAYQLRARVEELVLDLPEEHEVRRYAEQQMELLDRLGHASTKAHEGPRGHRDVPGRGGARGAGGPPRLPGRGGEADPRAGRRAAAAAMSSFEGASVLVTGGSRGIGRGSAPRLAERGAGRGGRGDR